MRKRSKSMYVSKKELEDCDLYHASEEEEFFTENPVEKGFEVDGWSPEQEIVLLNEIQKMIPKSDKIPYDQRWEKIDWTKINIKTFTEDEVKSHFSIMLENSRNFRLLGEILADLRQDVFGKLNVRKPTSPFGMFLLENSNELKRACHKQGHNYLQLASELYKKLSPEELEKYKKLSIKRRNEYNSIMGKLCVDEGQTKIVTNDPKLEGPLSIFYRWKQLKGEKVKLADIKREYKGLPKDEKLTWILKWASVNQGEKFSKDQYEQAKKTLTKLEMEIIDEYEGKPHRNLTAFLCYVKEFTSKFRDSNEKHVYQKAVDSWKSLSSDEKQIYQERIKKDKRDYKKELKAYYNSLPADRCSQNYSKTDNETKSSKVGRSSKNRNIEIREEISLGNEVLENSRKSIRRKLEMTTNDDENGEKISKKSKKQKILTDLLPIKTKNIGWEKTLDEDSKFLENAIKEENESQNENLLSSSKVTKRKVKTSSLVQMEITDDFHYNDEEQPINVDIYNYNDEEITNKNKKKKKKKNKEVTEVPVNVDNFSGCEEITESISKKIEKLLLRKPPRSTFLYFVQKIYSGPSKKAKKNFSLLTPTEKEEIVIQHNRAKQKFLKRVQKFGNSLKPHEFEENEEIIQKMLLDRDDEQSDTSDEEKS